MCELEHCTFYQPKDESMKKINKEFAVNHLYRIFIYGKGEDEQHEHSVQAFQGFLRRKGVQYSIRTLYDYAEGILPFPAALLPYLIEFSKDRELVSLFLPAIKATISKLNNKYAQEEKALKEKEEIMRQAKEELCRAEEALDL